MQAIDPVPDPKLPVPVSARESDLIRVVVQSTQIWDKKGLSRQLSPRNGFVLLQRTGSLDSVLADCERMAPCVLVADLVLVQAEGFDPERFSTRVEFGRSIQVLVVGPKRDPGLVEDLLRAGCVGFVTEDTSPLVLRKAVQAVAAGEFWADRRGDLPRCAAVVGTVGNAVADAA
jgi:DNA-binding NarL/FixJ family response regulator